MKNSSREDLSGSVYGKNLLGKIFFLTGVVTTLIFFPFYAWESWSKLSLWLWPIFLVIAPLVNGFIFWFMLVLSYPAYRWLAKNRMLGFDKIDLQSIGSASIDPNNKPDTPPNP